MKTMLLLIVVGSTAGCVSQGDELRGSEMTTDAKGRSQFVTYVSLEEYQRMTPEERERLNASVGTSATLMGSGEKPSRRVPEEDLEKLYPKP